ncbi:MAG: RNA-guided pseudouridylation complex pseudouridine synthase subunit Cbf5 [Nanoarchaeota archaeon]
MNKQNLERKSIKELLNFSIINIDKPSGPTSFSVSDYARKQLGLNKTSHFGTLDPNVSGVLPVALNRACKLTGFFLGHDKEYIGILHVHKEIEIQKIQEIIDKSFLGIIKQIPPRKSRVKRQERERQIYNFEILEKNDKNFLFKTSVQGGTYIRKLISDLGEHTQGAHMLELRRTKAGIFDEENCFNLYEFKEAVDELKKGNEEKIRKMLIPAETAIKKIFQIVQVNAESVRHLATGKKLFKESIVGKTPEFNEGDLFSVFFNDKFIEIARKINSTDKNIFARPEFVFN